MRLPHFLIIGGPRCGTSTLWFMLKKFPQLATWPKKEVHFFDKQWRRGLDWYAGRFKKAPAGTTLFEATPAYFHSPKVPGRIKQVMPDCKFVLLLRDPVKRAASHYWLHQDKFGKDPEVLIDSKHKAVIPGHYADHLENWLQYFDRKQILVFASEAFFAQPKAYAIHIAIWGGGVKAEQIKESWNVINGAEYHDPLMHRKNLYGHIPRIPKEVMSWLRLHYKPYNERLRKMLAPYDITVYWGRKN